MEASAGPAGPAGGRAGRMRPDILCGLEAYRVLQLVFTYIRHAAAPAGGTLLLGPLPDPGAPVHGGLRSVQAQERFDRIAGSCGRGAARLLSDADFQLCFS